ncbi:S-adenosylmethionine uptake transporter [Rhizobium sp. RU20A]|uniref:DMT family transporter n=1 Tax=Rhizobium sp. RU20A TaxID=1907412 RepID=UPI000956D04D|nr:DMT family transporter [Rhizobium sp. RU20A]SIQ21926.1 S-adenosylmethionine uptake transporter [Rhizobium sp. RU20A]
MAATLRPTPVAALNDIPAGLTLMVLSVLVSPLIDVFGKLALATIPSGQIVATRFVLQVAFLLPIVVAGRRLKPTSASAIGLNAVRGALLVIGMFSFMTALIVMQIADALAIFFVEPIILTILGGLVLREKIGWRRYLACAVGFGGAMLVIRPSLEDVGLVALLPVVSAFCVAIFVLITRRLAQSEDPFAMQLHAGIWALGFSLIALWIGSGSGSALFDPVWPDRLAIAYLIGVGLTATVAGVLGVYAYRAAPASVLAPLQYLEIVSGTLFGYLVFDHLPDALKWLGIAIIIGSGLTIIWRERVVSRRESRPDMPPVPPVA